MTFIGKLFSSTPGGDRGDPWPERPHVSTELLRDWWVVDCWFHRKPDLAEAQYEGFVRWGTERPPDSIPYLSWAPYTKVRVDLACLKAPATPEIEKQYKNAQNRYYVVAFCYARNEYLDVEQYQTVWRQSEDYESFAQMADDPKSGWPKEGLKVTPDWYHQMIMKTAGSQWLGYRGFDDRKMADLG